MTSITSNQLIQAAALDPSLAFSAVFNQTKSLIQQSAYAGVQGLLNSLSESNAYTQSIEANQDAIAALAQAEALRASHQFATGDSTQVQNNETAVISGLTSQLTSSMATAVSTASTNAESLVTTINGDKNASSAAKSAAALLQTAASDATSAVTALQNATTPAQVTAAINQINAAQTAYQSALSAVNALDSKDSYKSSLTSDTTALGTALSPVVSLTQTPIASIAQVTPTVQSLNADQGDSAYTISTWGTTGYTTIMDSSGKGVLVQPNGQVTSLDGSTNWHFSNTGTFVLPDSTKITINPSSSGAASVTAVWGDHLMTIGNVQSGSTPTTSIQSGGGRSLEGHTNGNTYVPTFNDGSIFYLGSNASQWKDSSGGTLQGGEDGSPTSGFNQLQVDPTAVSVSSNVTNFMTSYGLQAPSIGNNGKYDDTQLASILGGINFVVGQIQANYEQTIANTQAAATALGELTAILDNLTTQSTTLQENRSQLDAQETEALVNVRLRLETALSQLTGSGPTTPESSSANGLPGQVNAPNSSGNLITDTENLLQGLQQFNPNISPSSPSTVPGATPLNAALLGGPNSLLGQLAGGAQLSPQQVQALAQQIAGVVEQAVVTGGVAPQALQGLAQQLVAAVNLALGAGVGLSLQSQQALGQQILATLSSPESLAALGGLGAKGIAALSQAIFNALVLPSIESGAGSRSGELPGPNPFERLDPSNQALRRAGRLLSGLGNFSARLNFAQAGSDIGVVGVLGSAFGGQVVASQGALPSQVPLNPEVPGGGSHNVFAQLEGELSQSQLNPFTQASTLPTFNQLVQEEAQILEGQLNPPGLGQEIPPGSLPFGTEPPTFAFPPFQNPNPNAPQVAVNFGLGGSNQGQQGSQEGSEGLAFNTADISKNFQTDPSLLRVFQQRLDQAIQVQQLQVNQAGNLFHQAQETVRRFVQIIAKDEGVQKIIMSQDLSDAQQVNYQEKMTDLRKRWGIEWGSSTDSSTPAGEQQLVSRVIQSGMMV